MSTKTHSRLATLAALFSATVVGVVLAGAASAEAQSPPASYYGIAAAGDRIEAKYNALACAEAPAGPDGFWSLKVLSGGACGVTEGAALAFFRNGVDSGARETFKSGGVPASIMGGVNVGGGALKPAPAPPSITTGAPFSGGTPGPDGAALLVTTREATPDALRTALSGAGCRLQALAVLREGRWLVYIEGAPALVNAGFPASLPQTSAFFARC
jgi:hypothetical protein